MVARFFPGQNAKQPQYRRTDGSLAEFESMSEAFRAFFTDSTIFGLHLPLLQKHAKYFDPAFLYMPAPNS